MCELASEFERRPLASSVPDPEEPRVRDDGHARVADHEQGGRVAAFPGTEGGDLKEVAETGRRICAAVEQVIEGKPDVVQLAVTVLFAEGHLLIEDVPGVGKTMLAKALAKAIDCSVRRIQFTPDLLPERHHRRVGVQPGHPRVRVQARAGLRQHRRRRRDQPRLAKDPIGAAGEHGRTAGDRRRNDLPTRGTVHGRRHPEPDRDGRHLPAARSAARPFHRPAVDGLPVRDRRTGNARFATAATIRSTTCAPSPTLSKSRMRSS